MPKFGLPHAHRPYVCTVCGHEQEIATNHTDQCSAICKGCSWKGIGFGAGHQIPALGSHTYRVFRYAGEEFDDTIPVSDPEAEATHLLTPEDFDMGGN